MSRSHQQWILFGRLFYLFSSLGSIVGSEALTYFHSFKIGRCLFFVLFITVAMCNK
jgi:hypothetical protein